MDDMLFEAEPTFDEPVPMTHAIRALSAGTEMTPPMPPAPEPPNDAVSHAIEGIRALDDSIRTLEDLKTMPEAEVFYQHVLRGNTLEDAYRLTHFERLSAKRSEAAQQAALSRAFGKRHLSGTPVQGTRTQPIPADTLALYRELHPGLRDEDYRSHYARYNGTGR